MSFDRTQPYTKRRTRTGFAIFEHAHAPGVYCNANGGEVDHEQAKDAGFNVEEGKRSRRRQELEKEALANIDAQMAAEAGAIEDKIADEFDDVPTIPYMKKVGTKYSVFDAKNIEVAAKLTKREAQETLEGIRAQ